MFALLSIFVRDSHCGIMLSSQRQPCYKDIFTHTQVLEDIFMCRYMHIVSYSQGFLRFVRCCRHHRSLVCWTGLGCCRRCPRPICVKCKFKSYWKRGLCDSSRRHMKKRDVVGDLASPSPSWLFIHFAGFFFSALLVQLKMSLLLL